MTLRKRNRRALIINQQIWRYLESVLADIFFDDTVNLDRQIRNTAAGSDGR